MRNTALNIEQFGWNPNTLGSIDHRIVKAPYIRLEEYKNGNKGDYVFKYDLRFTQPNTRYINADILHSLEHFLLVGLRKSMNSFINVAPMGCQTGFYLILLNEYDATNITSHLEKILDNILIAHEVPLQNIQCCGHASSHNLEGAKKMAEEMLAQKQSWLTVF